jgi:hypothetical protein
MDTEMLRLVVMLGAAAGALALGQSRQAASEPAAVERYLEAQKSLERHQISVEQLYEQTLSIHDQLLQRSGSQATLLERLDPAAYQSVEKRLKTHGLVVNREETVFVAIDPAFFLTLARHYGARRDIEFFSIYEQMYPRGSGYIWPAYVEQQTDATGCTSFAPHTMIDLYTRWKLYRSRFPTAYQKTVNDSIQGIEAQFAGATCTCEDRSVVATELKGFLAKFPDEKVSPAVAARLRDIEEGHSPIRFSCLSG